jgi:hypothetical protein
MHRFCVKIYASMKPITPLFFNDRKELRIVIFMEPLVYTLVVLKICGKSNAKFMHNLCNQIFPMCDFLSHNFLIFMVLQKSWHTN